MDMKIDMQSLIHFYLEAGVDETIDDAPVNRLAQSPVRELTPTVGGETGPSAPPAAVRPVTPQKKAESARPAPAPKLADAIRFAQQTAQSCRTIDELRQAVETFEHCSLRKSANHTVFAKGDPGARLMIIDRQPCDEEDRSGLPFSNGSGELLEKMLAAIGLSPDDAYYVSAIPWRPPGMRELTDEEKALCLPFIHRHIEITNPSYILACGEAAGYLLDIKTGINKLRGKWKDLQIGQGHAKILPIFHPAFLMSQPALKKYAWADLLMLKAAMGDD
tara:strand:+ start:876 stop:1703 length:828 start_codon:yes stop_codon:yes gene_type:complete